MRRSRATRLRRAWIVAVAAGPVSKTVEGSSVDTLIPRIVPASGRRVDLAVLTADTRTAPKVVEGFLGL